MRILFSFRFLLSGFLLLWGQNYMSAQTLNWQWAKYNGLTFPSISHVTDHQGNCIIYGGFHGSSVTFDAITLQNTDSVLTCGFIAKFGNQGNCLWAKKFPALLGNSEGLYVTVDDSDNIVVDGWFKGTALHLDTIVLQHSVSSGYDLYLAKMNSSGNYIWAKTFASNDWDEPGGLVLDHQGNIYMAGEFWGDSISFDATTLHNSGASAGYVVRFDNNGNVIWAIGSTSNSYAYGIGLNNFGQLYVDGTYYDSTLILGNGQPQPLAGGQDFFIARIDTTNGNVLWTRSGGGNADEYISRLKVDQHGNAYACGAYESTNPVFGTVSLTNAGGADAVVIKYDSLGNAIWAKGLHGNALENINEVDFDSTGNLIFAGAFNSSSLSINTFNLTNAGDYDMIIGQMDTTGNITWIQNFGGSGIDILHEIDHDSNYNFIVSGTVKNSNFSLGTLNVQQSTSTNNFGIFVAKFSVSSNPTSMNFNNNTPITFYPNPVIDELSIIGASNSSYRIYNMVGQFVGSGKISHEAEKIDLSRFIPGEYYIQLENSLRKEIVSQLVIQ